jgi:hypothetical protein
MATSGTVSWTATTNDIITQAAFQLGKLGVGEQLEAQEYNNMLWRLNAMTKQWIAGNDYAPGLKTWTREYGTCFLSYTSGQYVLGSIGGTSNSYWTQSYLLTYSGGNNSQGASIINCGSTYNAQVQPIPASINSTTGALQQNQYVGIQLDNGNLYWSTITEINSPTTFTIEGTLPSGSNSISNVIYAFSEIATPPQLIETIVLRDAQQNDTDVTLLTQEQWMSFPSKQAQQNQGDPIGAYYEPHLVGNDGQGYGLLFTDVATAGDVSKTLYIGYLSEIQDFTNATDEMYFPKEWAEALMMGLSARCAKMFNVNWTQEDTLLEVNAFKLAKNAHKKRSIRGFNVSDHGEVHQLWR